MKSKETSQWESCGAWAKIARKLCAAMKPVQHNAIAAMRLLPISCGSGFRCSIAQNYILRNS
jgi:hypothetical protein